MTERNCPDWEALARYAAGECSEKEEAEILAWEASASSHRALLESVREAWRASRWPPGGWDVERALAKVKRVPSRPDPGRPRVPELRAPRAERRTYPRMSSARRLAIAAGLAVVGLAGAWHLAPHLARPGPVAVQELVTPKGQRAELRLADGTRVVLGPGSRLETLPDFGAAAREVRLSGEAYFDVAGDPARPFRVYVGDAVTQVLGTQFGIRAYPDDAAVSVVVEEGSVSLRSVEAADAAVLEAGELGELPRGGAKVSARPVDPDAHLAWRDGHLAFDNTPLTDVARDLERWYGVRVRIADASLRPLRLTASFRDQPIEVVLDVVAASLDLTWKRVGKTYVFTRTTVLLATP